MKLNIGGKVIGSGNEYLSKIRYSEHSMTYIQKAGSMYDRFETAESYALTKQAKGMVSDPEKFRKQFGDYFIAGMRRG